MKPKLGFRSFSLKDQDKLKQIPLNLADKAYKLKEE